MKSLIVQQSYIKDPENYSELIVMSSQAGFYIGTTYWNNEYQMYEPGTRDTRYFNTYEEADEFLTRLEANDEEAIEQLRTIP